MDDRDLIHGEADEDSTVEGKELDRESEAPGANASETAKHELEDDEALVRKEEYGSRPA